VVLALFIPRLEVESSLKSAIVTTSPAYREYEKVLEVFGHEDLFVIAIKTPQACDSDLLRRLAVITSELQKLDEVVEVLSVADLRFFRQRKGRFGSYPVVQTRNGHPTLPEEPELARIRQGFPLLDLLLSEDLKTVGIIVRADDQWKFDTQAIRRLLSEIDRVVKSNVPEGSDYRIIGAPVIRQAITKYSLQTAVIFGVLSCLICLLVTVYVFKSLAITAITLFILGLCVVWVLGLMAWMGIPISPTTSMSFGVILLTTLEVVIHMVARSRQFRSLEKDWEGAVAHAFRYLGRPLLISAVTTAVGFGTCMVSDIPMVRHLGLIMTLAIPVSFCLAMVLTPLFLLLTGPPNSEMNPEAATNLLGTVLLHMENGIAKYYRQFTIAGIVIAVGMFAGFFFINVDAHMSRQLSQSSPEIRNIRFVEAHLTSVECLELVLKSEPGDFKKADVWKRVKELENRLKTMPEVAGLDSFFPSLMYVHHLVNSTDSSQRDLFAVPGLIPELFVMSMLSGDGKRLVHRFVNDRFDQLRILIRLKNSRPASINETINRIETIAKSVMDNTVQVRVTGETAVFAAVAGDLIRAHIESILLASLIITLLMMFQMGSVSFGLVSLIPNIPPIGTVFGLMGWFGIPLNSVTIFAATVAIGLAADNTIQYVAQLKREIKLNPELGVEACVLRAYRLASSPMASWSIVTVLGFLALVLTPFQAAVNFGILVAAGVMMGMFGDLVLMQSVLLASPRLRNLVTRLIKKEMATQNSIGLPR
jgi:predicted RND superfamily exporter protein